MLPSNVLFLIKYLGISFFFFTISFTLFISFSLSYLHTTLGILIGGISVAVSVFSLNMIIYVMGISFRTGAALVMDRRGMVDQCSFVQWGFVGIEDIQYIGIRETLIGDILKVRFRVTPSFASLSFFQKINQLWIRLLDDKAIYIPLGVLEASRLNLESQFMHFAALMRHSAEQNDERRDSLAQGSTSGGILERMETSDEPTAISEVSITPSSNSMSESDKGEFSEKETVLVDLDELTAQTAISISKPLNATNAISKLQNIKEFIEKSQFDQKMCDLYTDYIVNFVSWQQDNDKRLPEAVVHPQILSRSNDYEEIGFVWNGKQFQFALRRDVGPANRALLSIACSGKAKMTLSVRVEIGSFEPGELEAFHYDDWCEIAVELYEKCTESQFSRNQGLEEETKIQELNLEELDQNFSIETKNSSGND